MKYPFKCYLIQKGKDLLWMAESEAFTKVFGIGDSFLDAIYDLERNESMWIFMADRYGLSLPELPAKEMN